MKKIILVTFLLLVSLFVFSQNAKQLTTKTFKSKIWNFDVDKSWKYVGEKPAIIYFYTDWSAACKKTTPNFKSLQKQFNGKINFYKVNSDDYPNISVKMGIREVPVIVFARKGRSIKKVSGKFSLLKIQSEAGNITK